MSAGRGAAIAGTVSAPVVVGGLLWYRTGGELIAVVVPAAVILFVCLVATIVLLRSEPRSDAEITID